MLFEGLLPAFEKKDKLVDDFHVLGAGYLADARRHAVVHVVFQAGASCVVVELDVAGAEGENGLDDIERMADRRAVVVDVVIRPIQRPIAVDIVGRGDRTDEVIHGEREAGDVLSGPRPAVEQAAFVAEQDVDLVADEIAELVAIAIYAEGIRQRDRDLPVVTENGARLLGGLPAVSIDKPFADTLANAKKIRDLTKARQLKVFSQRLPLQNFCY